MKVIRSGGLFAQGQKHALEGIVEKDASLAWKAMFSMIGYNRIYPARDPARQRPFGPFRAMPP